MKKSHNWPMVSFLVALTLCAILFIPDWEYAVQDKASSALDQILAGVALPLLGIALFSWSRDQAKQAKSRRYIRFNSLAVIVIVGWLAFSIFALFVGLVLAPIYNKGFDNLSF